MINRGYRGGAPPQHRFDATLERLTKLALNGSIGTRVPQITIVRDPGNALQLRDRKCDDMRAVRRSRAEHGVKASAPRCAQTCGDCAGNPSGGTIGKEHHTLGEITQARTEAAPALARNSFL